MNILAGIILKPHMKVLLLQRTLSSSLVLDSPLVYQSLPGVQSFHWPCEEPWPVAPAPTSLGAQAGHSWRKSSLPFFRPFWTSPKSMPLERG